MWLLKYEIDKRRLIFLKRILGRDNSDPCLQVYKEMLKFKDKPNWTKDVLGLRVKYNLPLHDDNIRNMLFDDWNTFGKTAVRREVFLWSQVEFSFNKKTNHIVIIYLNLLIALFSYLLL